MELIAHRGCAAVFPENTVMAARASATRLPAVEIDIRRCATGELVCIHDATVDRVTDGTGRVVDLSFAEIAELEVRESDASIPTLTAVLAVVPERITLQLELKEPGLGDDVLEAVDGRSNVRLSSFDLEALRDVRDGPLPSGYLFDEDPSQSLDLAEDVGCTNVHPHWRTCAESSIVQNAHDRGFSVYAWGAKSDPSAVSAAREAGVDGITVDRPDL